MSAWYLCPQRWWEKPHLTSCDLKCGLESNRWRLTHSCNLYLKLKGCYFRQSSENLFEFSVAVLCKKKVFTFARSLHKCKLLQLVWTSVCRRQAWCSSFMGFFFFFWPCLCPFAPTEQIFHNLRQECSRIQRRRQLEGAFNQAEACSSSDATSPISSLNAPSSPQGQKHSSKWLCDAINSPWWSSVLNSNVMPDCGKRHVTRFDWPVSTNLGPVKYHGKAQTHHLPRTSLVYSLLTRP